MKITVLMFGMCLMLVGCGQSDEQTALPVDKEVVEESEESNDFEESEERASKEEERELAVSEENVSLRTSFEEAREVRSLLRELEPSFPSDMQAALSEALAAFDASLDELFYFVELSEQRPLSEDEIETVAQVSFDVEYAIELFAQVIENLSL